MKTPICGFRGLGFSKVPTSKAARGLQGAWHRTGLCPSLGALDRGCKAYGLGITVSKLLRAYCRGFRLYGFGIEGFLVHASILFVIYCCRFWLRDGGFRVQGFDFKLAGNRLGLKAATPAANSAPPPASMSKAFPCRAFEIPPPYTCFFFS